MKRYRVCVDYTTTCDIFIEARNEESAANKAEKYVRTKKGIEEIIAKCMFSNIPYGIEVVLVAEDN